MEDITPMNPYILNNQSQPPLHQQINRNGGNNLTPLTDGNINSVAFSHFNGTNGFYPVVEDAQGRNNAKTPPNCNGDLPAVTVKTEEPIGIQSAGVTAESMQTVEHAEVIHTGLEVITFIRKKSMIFMLHFPKENEALCFIFLYFYFTFYSL